jgi:hypothetical protein
MAHTGETFDASVGEIAVVGNIPKAVTTIDASIRAGTRAKKLIIAASQQHHKIPLVYKETLRALLNIFGGLKYVTPSNDIVPIKCVHGNPERIVAKLTEQTNITLPIISVIQTNTEDAITRRRYEPTIIHEKYFDEEKQRAIRVLSLVPKALNINYNINIWSKYRSDLDQILEQIRLLFNPELLIPTPFSSSTKAYISTEFDNSTLTAGDKEDRILKRGVTISVETYLPNPKFLVTSSGKIERIKSEFEIY